MPTHTLLLLACLAGAASAAAGEVVTWVDAAGVTHFGNPQLAPTRARPVELAPANGMDVPAALPHRPDGNGPHAVVLKKAANREVRGWRGHEWSVQRRHR